MSTTTTKARNGTRWISITVYSPSVHLSEASFACDVSVILCYGVWCGCILRARTFAQKAGTPAGHGRMSPLDCWRLSLVMVVVAAARQGRTVSRVGEGASRGSMVKGRDAGEWDEEGVVHNTSRVYRVQKVGQPTDGMSAYRVVSSRVVSHRA